MNRPVTEDPSVSVVIPVKDKRRFLEECVGSVVDAIKSSPASELIIVDNGSTDGSLEFCRSLAGGEVRVLEAAGTIAKVRNTGAGAARGEWLYFLDCDCVVPPDLLGRLAQVLRDPHIEVTGCAVEYPTDRSWIERTWFRMHRRADDGPRDYINSGNLVVRRRIFAATGGFDATLVTGEDAELGLRLRAAGHLIHERRSLAVLHRDNPTTLRAFFRKEVWRGLGASGTTRGLLLDRPTSFAILHVAALLLAPGAFLLGLPTGRAILLTSAAIVLMPAIAVGARFVQVRRRFSILQGVVLYWVYLVARAVAVVSKPPRR